MCGSVSELNVRVRVEPRGLLQHCSYAKVQTADEHEGNEEEDHRRGEHDELGTPFRGIVRQATPGTLLQLPPLQLQVVHASQRDLLG